MQLSTHHTAMVQAANHWVYLLQTDSVPAHPDSLRKVWQQVRTPAARYAEAALLLAQGEHADAEEVIEDMEEEEALNDHEEAERGRMLKYIGVLADAAAESRNAYQLESNEVAVLDSMVMHNCDRPSVWARNLLCAVYGICHTPCTGGGDGGNQQPYRLMEPEQPPVAAAPALRLQPNPASSGVTMVYSLPGNTGAAKLLVRDISGRVVQEFTVGGAEGQAMWTVQQVTPGVYSVELRRNGELISTERLVIQR